MFSYVVLVIVILFTITFNSSKCILNESVQPISKSDQSYRTNAENNLSDHSTSLKQKQTSPRNYEYSEGGVNGFPAYFNGSVVERPNPRIVLNKTTSSKTGWEQVHQFFSDKAREDAYQKTEAKEHPYSIVFLAYGIDRSITVCSGTLISPRLVLTAAHCVVDLPAVKLDIFAGITINIFKQPIPSPLPYGSQKRTSTKFHPHGKYDPMSPNADYDIALIKVSPEFELTEFVQPIEVATTPWKHPGLHQCVLTAFGSVRDEPNNSPDDFIRKTQQLEVEKPCFCDVKLKRSMGIGATSRYICMRPKEDFGICSGDSGGGLVCDGELTAIVSISVNLELYYPCKKNARIMLSDDEEEKKEMCGGKDTLSIFQDVTYYATWIKKSAINSYLDDDSAATSTMLNLNSCLYNLLLSLTLTLLKGRYL